MLEDAKTSDKPKVTPSSDAAGLTAKEIEEKLQKVEDRRKSLEAQTLERLAEAEKRAAEVRERKATMPPPSEAAGEDDQSN